MDFCHQTKRKCLNIYVHQFQMFRNNYIMVCLLVLNFEKLLRVPLTVSLQLPLPFLFLRFLHRFSNSDFFAQLV